MKDFKWKIITGLIIVLAVWKIIDIIILIADSVRGI